MNYFVTIDGKTSNYNLNREHAIRSAKYEASKGAVNIGIGKYKYDYNKGKSVYKLVPLSFYI